MARQTPAALKPTIAGTTWALSAPIADGDAVPPSSALLVTNGSGSPITVTLVTPGVVGGDLAIADKTVSVPAAGSRLIGGYDEAHYIQKSGATKGLVHVDYSSVTSVTRAVIQA